MNDQTAQPKDDTKLVIRRSYAAGIEALFGALTRPEAIREWFGPGGAVVHRAESDLRPGGKWLIEMQSEDCTEHNVSGEYTEVDPPHRVAFTWAWHSTPDHVSLVTYALTPVDAGNTTLTLTHERLASLEARDRHEFGWNGSLDKLGPWLAQ